MMNLGIGALCKISAELKFGDHSPRWCAPPKVSRSATTLGKSAQAV